MENTPTLHTPRLILSRFTPEDAPAMHQGWANDPMVCRHLLLQPGMTLEGCEQTICRLVQQYHQEEDFFQWAIREQTHCIGRIGLTVNRRHQSGSVAYYLAQAAWGKGFMPEALAAVIDFAFFSLDLNRVEADHFAENPASGRVMEKAGMVREGLARQKYCKNGVFHDAVLYAALRDDWRTCK